MPQQTFVSLHDMHDSPCSTLSTQSNHSYRHSDLPYLEYSPRLHSLSSGLVLCLLTDHPLLLPCFRP